VHILGGLSLGDCLSGAGAARVDARLRHRHIVIVSHVERTPDLETAACRGLKLQCRLFWKFPKKIANKTTLKPRDGLH
jgi:hypothetical protein